MVETAIYQCAHCGEVILMSDCVPEINKHISMRKAGWKHSRKYGWICPEHTFNKSTQKWE
jgi:hypothetical protein